MTAATPPTADHICPHCDKRFDRRDLKERHRRRCEKSIHKVPTTKKRSCQSCIASKVKCDWAHPSCSRCRNRQTKCEYKLDVPTTHFSQQSTTATPPNSARSVTTVAPDDGPARLLVAGESMASDTFDPQLWFTQDLAALTPEKTGFEALMSPAPFLYGLQLPSSSSSWGSGFPMGEGDPIALSLHTPADRPASVASHQELTSLRSGHFGEGGVLNPLPTNRGLSRSSSSHGQSQTPQAPVDIRQGLQMISDYPARMLAMTSQSPFIHSRLTHGSPQGMPEPIAVALACVGMKLQSQNPAKNFVCNIFRDQREKIIAELPTGPQRLEDLCSYLHALSIYQIEGLLSSNRYEAPFSSAELHHEYLIKMTRRLSRTHRAVLLGSGPEDRWETWVVAETFRRTFYLVFLVHHLLHASKRLMPAYFEPLLDLTELRPLRLPCTEEMWNAPDAEDWARACQQLDQQQLNQLCLGELLDAMTTGGGSPDQSSRLGMLGELPRLIISVVNSTCVAEQIFTDLGLS